MEHKTVLTEAARVLTQRAAEYGTPEDCFTRIATVASQMLGRDVSRYECAAILTATKIGRMMESPTKADTYVDLCNYASFMSQFSGEANVPTPKLPFSIPSAPRREMPSLAPEPAFTPPPPLDLRQEAETAISDALNSLDDEVDGPIDIAREHEVPPLPKPRPAR
jgi:hypothetical protein